MYLKVSQLIRLIAEGLVVDVYKQIEVICEPSTNCNS